METLALWATCKTHHKDCSNLCHQKWDDSTILMDYRNHGADFNDGVKNFTKHFLFLKEKNINCAWTREVFTLTLRSLAASSSAKRSEICRFCSRLPFCPCCVPSTCNCVGTVWSVLPPGRGELAIVADGLPWLLAVVGVVNVFKFVFPRNDTFFICIPAMLRTDDWVVAGVMTWPSIFA